MGRSFVRLEYQRDVEPLMLLWKGIATYAAIKIRSTATNSERCRSVRQLPRHFHQTLCLAFLTSPRQDFKAHSVMVRPRNPVDEKPSGDWDPRALHTVVDSVDDIDELVNEIESYERSVPILVRQYSADSTRRFSGLTLIPDFSDVVDGLVLIDLMKMDRRLLKFYMGAENLNDFVDYQQRLQSEKQVSAEPLLNAR